MLLRILIIVVCVAGSLLPVEGADTIIIGGETRVIDGDTLEVKGERVRLEGIDAPEKGQSCRNASGELYPCGQAVIYALHGRIGEGNVVCAIDAARDRYGRALGGCSLGGEDLNAWLVSEGHALAYRRYSLKYVEQEEAARADGRGIWAGDFVAPWDWRRGERLADSMLWLCTTTTATAGLREARGHGIAPVGRDHPAYRYMDDRDGDDVVCE